MSAPEHSSTSNSSDWSAELFSEQLDSEPNLTPLIDVVFILLIFFIVTATFSPDIGLAVQRPSATNTQEITQKAIRLAIDRHDHLTINGELIQKWRLVPELKERISQHHEKQVVLVADRMTDLQNIVQLMDQCYEAGAAHIALSVQKQQ